MGKRRPSLDAAQLGFSFDVPVVPVGPASLAGLDRKVAAAVGIALKDDARSREEIAAAMSSMLGEEVTRWMLDGYASEARETVNISLHRFLALIAACKRPDLLDRLLREIGAAAIVGEEMMLARLGDIETNIKRLRDEHRALMACAKPLQRGR